MQSLESIPTWFSDFFDITLESGQVILSGMIIFAVLLPIMYLNRDRKGHVIEVLVLFLLEAVLVGIQWLSYWVLIGTIAMMALAIAFLGFSGLSL